MFVDAISAILIPVSPFKLQIMACSRVYFLIICQPVIYIELPDTEKKSD